MVTGSPVQLRILLMTQSIDQSNGLAVRLVVAGGSGGVEFDDKLEALDVVSNSWKI